MLIKHQRTIEGIHRAAGDDDNVFELAISSEAPYERWFGIEILSHAPSAVDLTRLGDGRHPLLLGHDIDKQIGVIRKAYIGDDKKLRGDVRFSRSALGQEIKMDVEDEIRTLVSVGYFIEEIEEVEENGKAADGSPIYTVKRTLTGEEFEREMRSTHGDTWQRSGPAAARAKGEQPPVYVVTRWQPFEASVVPVPADASVGFGRSAGADSEPQAPAPPAAVPATPLITLENRIMTDPIKTPAELEIERRDAIIALGETETYKKYLKPTDLVEAIRNGMSRDKFIELIMERMASKHTDTSAAAIGMSQREKQRYSLSRAIVAASTGNWQNAGFELECSRAVEKLTGQTAQGFLLPNDLFQRDFNVGTSSEAGNLVPTEFRGDLFVDVLRNNLVASQLGVRMLTGLTGNVDIPRKATSSTIGTTTEIGSASETNPTTAKLTLSPKRMSAFVEVSLKALQQSGMALDAMIRDDLLQGVAVQIENGYINGTGTDPQMTGLRYASIGTSTAGTNAATIDWSHIVGLETGVANNNAEPDRLAGYLINTKTRGKLKQVQKGTNLPFIWDNGPQPLNGYRAAVSNNVPSNLTKGTSTTVCSAAFFSSDWSMSVIGLFGAPDVVVDPYTKADTGQVKVTINAFADSGVRQPNAFHHYPDLLTA